jgi:two-component sensor histidine kinase
MVNAMAADAWGSRSHITSLKPIRPENRPDPWEEAALQAFEAGEREVSSLEQMDDGEYVRFMRPFVTEKACLRCHASQGYREGDIRGGISVSVPTAPLRAIQGPIAFRMSVIHLGLWLAGVVGIVVSRNGLAREIAAREKVQETLRQSEEHTKASLREKELLLKEIHHRVKNNMQVISSLVSLQADALSDGSVREVLRNVTDRVRSMALVHEKLYQSADLAQIDFAEYARSLLQYLWRAYGNTAPGVRLATDLEPVWLDVETAVPCGLMLNELASNALKHAFRGRAEGEVAVSLRRSVDGQVCLEVRDNGVGLPPGTDWRQARSLGLHLIEMLSGQLGATVEVRNGQGTAFQIIFGDAAASSHP